MRILLLCEGNAETRDSFSGSSKSIVDGLRSLGNQVVCGNVEPAGIRRIILAARTYAQHRRRWWTRFHLAGSAFTARSKMAQKLVKENPDIDIILQFGATFSIPSFIKKPVCLYSDGNIHLSEQAAITGQTDGAFLSKPEITAVKSRESTVYKRVARIMTISDRIARSFIEDFGIPQINVVPVYAGPNININKIPKPDEQPVQDYIPTILFIGRQFGRKGGDVLLAAFEEVKREVQNVKLIIIGPDKLDGLPSGVEFLGFLKKDTQEGWSKLVEAYQKATVYCMPTRYEGLSISFIEAMFFGLPCVSTLSPWTPPEMIINGETGFIVDHEDIKALAERLSYLLRNPREAKMMGLKGRSRAEKLYTWQRVTERMENLMKEVLEETKDIY